MLKWQSIGFHFSALKFSYTFQNSSPGTILNEKFDNNCVSELLRFCHRYKEWILSIYQISETLDKDAEMAKRILFVTFKTKLQSKINLAILKFESNYEFKMRAFSHKHFKMNTNIIVSWSVIEIVSSVGAKV